MVDNSKVILLVEDNPNDQVLTQMAFKKNNIANHVVVANDGEEALDYLFGNGAFTGRDITDTPQVIILDLKLPKVDGLEVLQKIRTNERTRHIPVVILTTSNEDKDIMEAYNLGTNAYVRKPVDFNEFASAVQNLGMFWLLLNETTPKRVVTSNI